MKISSKIAGLLIAMFVVAFVGCSSNSSKSSSTSTSTSSQTGRTDTTMTPAARLDSSNFIADMTGTNEVPAVQTNAHGMAYFQVSDDSSKIIYTIKLSHADSVTMAHIHYGVVGKTGPIVVWLYPGPEYQAPTMEKDSVNGVLITDTLTSADLEGPMHGAKIKTLIHSMLHDSTYVNVHNKAHPSGYIRGQIISTSTGTSNNSNK